MVEVIAISNRCELLTLEIYFLESVWSSVGLRQKAQSGTAIISTMKISLWFVVRPAFARYNSIACKFTLVSTHEDCYPSFGNVSYKSTRDRGQTKNHGDSMVGVIVTSNRCELEPLENLFSRGSLRLGRWETLAPTGTTITTTMKTSPCFNIWPTVNFSLFMHKHCVAKTKEAVTFFDGVLIRF